MLGDGDIFSENNGKVLTESASRYILETFDRGAWLMKNRGAGTVCGGKGSHAEGAFQPCNERVLGRWDKIPRTVAEYAESYPPYDLTCFLTI